jgi:Cys-tRNA(Pro)/Cys-tRNA(Cys) deacylase
VTPAVIAARQAGVACQVVEYQHDPGAKSFGLEAAEAAASGAKKAVMADPKAAERATGYVIGGISPLGQRRGLPTVIDESALTHEQIYVSGGRRGLEIAIGPRDLVTLTNASVGSIGR